MKSWLSLGPATSFVGPRAKDQRRTPSLKIIEDFKTATAGHSEVQDPPEHGALSMRTGATPRKPGRAVPPRVLDSNTQGYPVPSHPSPNPSASVPKSKISKVLFFSLLISPTHLSKSSRRFGPELLAHLTDGALRSWKCQGPGQEWLSWETNPGKDLSELLVEVRIQLLFGEGVGRFFFTFSIPFLYPNQTFEGP